MKFSIFNFTTRQARKLSAFLFLVFFLLCLSNCEPHEHQITPAFYHWQTELKFTNTEKQYLASLSAQKLYIKFFDVDWDFTRKEAIAKATLITNTEIANSLTIVPTIFITNRTLVHLPTNEVKDLVDKVVKKLIRQFRDFPNQTIQEIQIDCDWTLSTKDKYFQLLTFLNRQFSQKAIYLSSTIRLHQIKYPEKMGIPPVKRGMLMDYNMGEETN